MKKIKLFKTLLVLGVLMTSINTAWAWYSITDADIYYDNSMSNWDANENVVILIEKYENQVGSGKGCTTMEMDYIDNTLLWHKLVNYGTEQVNCVRFGSKANVYEWYGWWTNNSDVTIVNGYDMGIYESWGNITNRWALSIQNEYKMFGANSSSKGADLSKTDLTGWSNLNSTMTIKAKIYNGSEYADGVMKGAVSASSYKFTSATSCEYGTSGSVASGATSGDIEVGYTALTTLSVSSVASGFKFKGWYGSDGTRLSPNATFNTYHPASVSDFDVYAYFEPAYTVNVVAGEGGYIVTPEDPATSVTASYSVSAAIVATPIPGYRFSNWTTSDDIEFDDENSASTTITATGNGTVTANFVRHYAYIVGRFHVQNEARNRWTNTFAYSSSPWWESSYYIEFDYDDTKHVFYRRTYATVDELAEQLGDTPQDPWFFVKTSSSTGEVDLTNEKTYRHGSDASFTAAGKSNKLLLQENQGSGSVKFSSGDESGYVVIYFDESYVWYEVEPVTFKVNAASTSWSTATNWSPNVVPTSDLDVMIESPVVVDADAVAKSVMIHNDGTNTHKGKLTIGAGNTLIVEEDIKKTTNGSTKIATTDDVLHIESSSSGNGALVWGTASSTPGAAQVDFYSISGGSKGSSASVNQFVGTPFTGATNNWVYNYDNSWLYGVDYSGTSPAWKLLGGSDTMDPFEGYCLIYNGSTGHTYEMSGTLVSNADLTGSNKIALQYKDATKAHNENVLANSWTAPIKITAFNAASDFTNAEATIYIFNAGSPEDVESAGAAAIDATSAGQWITIPVKSVSWGGSTPTIQVIPSMQSFSVYSTSAGASLAMDYSTLVYDPAVAGTAAIVPNRAPKLEKEEAPVVTHLFVKSDSGYGDMLWMLERSDFDEGFDNGWDGRKIAGESVAPQLYAVSTDGEMAVDAVKNLDGTVIGFKAGSKDNVYTFTFDYDADETPLYLFDTDAEEETYTRVLDGNSYTFTTTDKDAHNRFVLRKSPTIATGVENVGSSANAEKAMKFIKDNQLYIIRGNHLYNAEGSMVK